MPERLTSVLVIDDDEDLCSSVSRLLKLDGHRVDTAGSVAEALDRDNWSDYFTILVDRKLPDGTAEQLLPKLKQRTPDASLIIITGHADLESSIVALRHGAEDYLVKPIEPDSLRAWVRRTAELKRTQMKLRETETRFRAIVDTAHCAIFTFDEQGMLESINQAGEEVFGYSANEVLGQNVRMLMPEPYLDENGRRLSHSLDSGEKNIIDTGREVVGRRKNGTIFPMNLAVTEVAVAGRRQFTGIVRDLTDEKRARQAERLASLGQMVASVSHEGRNALQRGQANLDMLRFKIQDNAAAIELTNRIETALDDLQRLFSEIREYAAPIQLETEQALLSDLWREAWGLVELQRRDRDAVLREEKNDCDLVCHVDRFRLVQVFRNLMENSLAACSDPVEIKVQCAETDPSGPQFVQLTLRDNGPGLTQEQKLRVFEPFFTTKAKGSGLGMAIASRIIEAHGGKIAVADHEPPGAAFLIELPR